MPPFRPLPPLASPEWEGDAPPPPAAGWAELLQVLRGAAGGPQPPLREEGGPAASRLPPAGPPLRREAKTASFTPHCACSRWHPARPATSPPHTIRNHLPPPHTHNKPPRVAPGLSRPQECWSEDPASRPSFADVVARLEHMALQSRLAKRRVASA